MVILNFAPLSHFNSFSYEKHVKTGGFYIYDVHSIVCINASPNVLFYNYSPRILVSKSSTLVNIIIY